MILAAHLAPHHRNRKQRQQELGIVAFDLAQIVERGIQDAELNKTRFVVLALAGAITFGLLAVRDREIAIERPANPRRKSPA